MKTLTPSERRTVRIGGIGVVIYLVLFFGLKGSQSLAAHRAAYERQVRAAHLLRSEVEIHEARALKLQRLMERTRIDPGQLSTNTVVAQTSAALQQAAQSGGLQLQAVRESLARSGQREIGTIQLDATGQPTAVLGFVARLERIGFPVVIESLQFSPDPRGPGMLKVHLNLVVLDFEQWKARPSSHA